MDPQEIKVYPDNEQPGYWTAEHVQEKVMAVASTRGMALRLLADELEARHGA